MFAPLVWLLKARPLVLVGALTLAAVTFVAFEGIGYPAEISASSTFLIAFGWLAFGVAPVDRARSTVGMVALGVPLAALNAAVALGVSTFQHAPREAVGMAIAGALFGSIVWLPGLLFSLVFIHLPVHHGTRAALEQNLDRRDDGAVTGAAMLGALAAVATGFHIAIVPQPLAVGALPLAFALGAALAVAIPALRRCDARRKLADSCVFLPLDDATRRELADAGTLFFGPGEAPTHALYARAPATYRTAPERLGYFAARSTGLR
jgi:hypothetical protein